MATIEDYYQKYYNQDGLLTFVYDVSTSIERQLIFYAIDIYEDGVLIHAAKTFDEDDILTIQLRDRETQLGQQLDLSNLVVDTRGGKKK